MNKNYDKRHKTYKTASHAMPKKKVLPKKKLTLKERINKFMYNEDYLQNRDRSQNTNSSREDINFNNLKSKSTISEVKKITPVRKSSNGSKIFKSTLIILIIIGLGLTIFFIPYISTAVNSYNRGFDTTRIDVDTVPHIYDKNGNLVEIMYGYYDSGAENFVPTYSSVYTDIATLPKYVGDAFTAIEDETFYDNSGINFNRLLYATFNYIIKGDSSFGGSTITQQLVKVATGDDSHSPARKAREIGSALYLTDNWSKAKILASYINLVYYGNGAYGIYEASMTYFDCEPKQLNIAQAAILASIPNSPDGLNPYGSENTKKKLLNRQKIVLSKMLELGLITDEQYTEAKEFNIEFKNGSQKLNKNSHAISPYLNLAFDEAISIVKEDCNCSNKEAIDKLLNGKTKIYLNLDVDFQNRVYEYAKGAYPDNPDVEMGGVFSNKSGEVLAVISSRTDSQVDHARYMTRQTGSAIKPLSVYGPAYDMGKLTPTSYVVDEPVSVTTSSGTWNVTNASNTFRGGMTATDAIAYSINTVAVTTLEKVGIAKSYEYLKNFGITSIDSKSDLYYPALALGGLTHGVSPYEMTQAYNAISNDGIYRNISLVNHIEIDGKTIKKSTNEHQVISADAAGKLKTSLNAVARYGTGRTAVASGVTSYLKTGTTNDVKDVWTCGFTDEATLCIWVGYDTPKHLNVYNANSTWKKIMNYYHGAK